MYGRVDLFEITRDKDSKGSYVQVMRKGGKEVKDKRDVWKERVKQGRERVLCALLGSSVLYGEGCSSSSCCYGTRASLFFEEPAGPLQGVGRKVPVGMKWLRGIEGSLGRERVLVRGKG